MSLSARVADLATRTAQEIKAVRDAAKNPAWFNIPLASGYKANTTAETPRCAIVNGIIYFEGIVTPVSGNFPINTNVDVTALGAIPARFTAAPAHINRTGAAQIATAAPRISVMADGRLYIRTAAVAASYIDISGLSGYMPTPS